MPFEVVGKELGELVVGRFAREARIYHGTSRQLFFVERIFPSVHFIHDHFPDSEWASGASLEMSVTFMRHTVVQNVRPQRVVGKRSDKGGVIKEAFLGQHVELPVATDSQVWGSHSYDAVVADVCESVDHVSGSVELAFPLKLASLRPPGCVGVVTVEVYVYKYREVVTSLDYFYNFC